jgi:hypothetical protein
MRPSKPFEFQVPPQGRIVGILVAIALAGVATTLFGFMIHLVTPGPLEVWRWYAFPVIFTFGIAWLLTTLWAASILQRALK